MISRACGNPEHNILLLGRVELCGLLGALCSITAVTVGFHGQSCHSIKD